MYTRRTYLYGYLQDSIKNIVFSITYPVKLYVHVSINLLCTFNLVTDHGTPNPVMLLNH
jgi:hypothetical protein